MIREKKRNREVRELKKNIPNIHMGILREAMWLPIKSNDRMINSFPYGTETLGSLSFSCP